jgi:hypothetical protein
MSRTKAATCTGHRQYITNTDIIILRAEFEPAIYFLYCTATVVEVLLIVMEF